MRFFNTSITEHLQKLFFFKGETVEECNNTITPVIDVTPNPQHLKEITSTTYTTKKEMYLWGLYISGSNTAVTATTTIGFNIVIPGNPLPIYFKAYLVPNAANAVNASFPFSRPIFIPIGTNFTVVSDVAGAVRSGYALLSEIQ